MAMTLAVFAIYGVFAAVARQHVISRPRFVTGLRRIFAFTFGALGARLAAESIWRARPATCRPGMRLWPPEQPVSDIR
jgi:hypothetical protein